MSDGKEEKQLVNQESAHETGVQPMEAEKPAETFESVKKEQQTEVDEGVKIVKERGNKDTEILEISGASPKEKKEFTDGEEKIERSAEEAKKEYRNSSKIIINNNNMESSESSVPIKTREEIIKELEEINKKIDDGYKEGMSLEENNSLKEQRALLLNLLGEFKYEDFGSEIGRRSDKTEKIVEGGVASKEPKGEFKREKENEIIAASEWSEKTQEEIKRLLGDPSSELSILLKAVNFREEYIQKLEADLEKAKLNLIIPCSLLQGYHGDIISLWRRNKPI